MNVLVVCGGISSERDISLRSGKSVGEALAQAGHGVTYFDPAKDTDLTLQLNVVDVVFPILHGRGGEDGVIQRVLESEGVPYVGSDSQVSAACFDKWQTIQQAPTILFPKSALVTPETIANSDLLAAPYVIKPRDEGSSVDTFLVRDPSQGLPQNIDEVFARHNNELLLEQLINGHEITVGILGGTALPVVEIIPPKGEDFDFSNKYNGTTSENCPPQFVSADLQLQAQKIALDLHNTMGCRDFSRTDMIIDNNNNIVTLEINNLPGMTKESLLPLAAKAIGVDMPMLVNRLVTLAFTRAQ